MVHKSRNAVRGTMNISPIRIPIDFDFSNHHFEYVRNPRYLYHNYVNQGKFVYDGQSLTLKWDSWPEEIYDKRGKHRYNLRTPCVNYKHIDVDLSRIKLF